MSLGDGGNDEEITTTTRPLNPQDILDQLDNQALVEAANSKQSRYEQTFSNESIEREAEFTKLQALKDHFKLKKEWSKFIKKTLAALLGFQSVLLAFCWTGLA